MSDFKKASQVPLENKSQNRKKDGNNPFPLVTAYICRRQIVGDHHTLADKIRQDVWKSNMFNFPPTRSDFIVACREPPPH